MRLSLPAGIVLILAMPVATAWLVGDLTDAEALALAAEGVPLDYGIEPISFGPGADRSIGIMACVAVMAAFAVLVLETLAARLRRAWWTVLLPLAAAGVVVGFGWRVWTAGGIGANIGAGLVLLLGGPLLLGLVIAALVPAVLLIRAHRRRASAL
jgi:hypothetical protein